jgi:hypothetical protein
LFGAKNAKYLVFYYKQVVSGGLKYTSGANIHKKKKLVV